MPQENLESFNPGDPFDAMAEQFRVRLCDMFMDAESITIFRDLESSRRLECFLAGTLAAIIGISFAHVEAPGRDSVMEYLSSCMPIARRMAEGIMENGGVKEEEDSTSRNDNAN